MLNQLNNFFFQTDKLALKQIGPKTAIILVLNHSPTCTINVLFKFSCILRKSSPYSFNVGFNECTQTEVEKLPILPEF